MKKLLAYDLDGTLINTGEDIAHSINFMLREMKFPELSHSEIFGYVGQGLHHLIGCCMKNEDRKLIERAAKIYRAYYQEHMLDHSHLYPGALEFLQTFRDKKQVLITNKPNPFALDMLKTLGIDDFFIKIVAGDQEFPRKPDPSAMLSIFKSEKIAAQDSVMIGDSLIDLEMGRKAGMTCVMLSHGFTSEAILRQAKPEGLCRDFNELLEFSRTEKW